MKKFLKFLMWLSIISLVLYAGYLFYNKFIKHTDELEADDLEDDFDEEYSDFEDECCRKKTFFDRVKEAADRQLEKVKA